MKEQINDSGKLRSNMILGSSHESHESKSPSHVVAHSGAPGESTFYFQRNCTIPRMNSFRLAVEIIFVIEVTIFSLFRPLVSAWPLMLWNFEEFFEKKNSKNGIASNRVLCCKKIVELLKCEMGKIWQNLINFIYKNRFHF